MKQFLLLTFCGIGVLPGCGRTRVAVPAEVPVAAVAVETPAGEPFQFPGDAGGDLLAKALTPVETRRLLNEPAVPPRPFPSPSGLAATATPLNPGQAVLPSAAIQAPTREVQPHFVTDETAFNPREELSLP